jgi:mRNA-degrading endonuclease RelE of RelBE toxin-antitoxin system
MIMPIVKDSPYGWAAGKPGWVVLHGHERRILELMMRSMKTSQMEEIEAELTEGDEKKKFYRLHVDNLRLAYELLFMARMTKW